MADKLYYDTSEANNLDALAVETDSSVATPSNVKNQYLFRDTNTREPLVGTMPVIASTTTKIDPYCTAYPDNNSYTIPKGYHDGTGKVTTGNLSEYTPGTAAVTDVVKNKVFWVNGERRVGTLDLEQEEQIGTATADDLAEGKTAWVNRSKITGTVPRLPRKDKTLLAGETYTYPYGISTGTSVISAADLASQTVATATASSIVIGKTAWVNGTKLTGTLEIDEELQEKLATTNATLSQVLTGRLFYSNVYKTVVTGTMVNHAGEATRVLPVGSSYAIPEGYYDGQTYIRAQALDEATVANAVPANLLVNKTAWVNGVKITGTMAFNDAVTTSLEPGQTYTIASGYHTGNGKVTVPSIASLTPGTATADKIVNSKTAWVNGAKIVGTMTENTPISKELSPGENYYIPAGYHTGAGNVWTKNLTEATAGTATADQILISQTAWVNGVKLTGTMPNNTASTIDLVSGDKYIIPEGYHTGSGKVKVASLASQTVGTATAAQITEGKTAWVNGEKLTGTLTIDGNAAETDVIYGKTFYNNDASIQRTGSLILSGSATEDEVLKGYTFYNINAKNKLTGTLELTGSAVAGNVLAGTTFYNTDAKTAISGTMPNVGAVASTILAGETYTVPAGYHDGTGYVRSPRLEYQTSGTDSEFDLAEGKTAWVNGVKLTGAMVLDGTATPDKVVAGYTYYMTSPKQKINGTMQQISTRAITLDGGETYTIPAGYHDGTSTVTAKDISEETPGTATAADILSPKTAWVDGVQLTGTIATQSYTVLRIAAGHDVTLPAGYYPSGLHIYAIYTYIVDLTGTDATVTEETGTLNPNSAGYVDEENATLVITAPLIE